MKATGIVRRIDDLGRIVIPKEIRRTLQIREGSPLEIYITREGEILLKKYSPMSELGEFAQMYADSLAGAMGELVCISDCEQIVAASGAGKREYEGYPISKELETLMDSRVNFVSHEDARLPRIISDSPGNPVNDLIRYGAIVPILANGDCVGSVSIVVRSMEKYDEAMLLQMAKTGANFLGKHMEN
ncbi:MAG: stage V sporulation T C-terminal domain-containing protein [Agathobacter sp.]|nr:stage V sporulation T C-terminal domain-containing protein [Agathobacter sp.]